MPRVRHKSNQQLTFAPGGPFCLPESTFLQSVTLICAQSSRSRSYSCVLSSDEGKIIHKTLINSGTKTNFPLSPSVSFSTFLFPYALVNLSVNANFGPTPFPFREPSWSSSPSFSCLHLLAPTNSSADLPRIRICIEKLNLESYQAVSLIVIQSFCPKL